MSGCMCAAGITCPACKQQARAREVARAVEKAVREEREAVVRALEQWGQLGYAGAIERGEHRNG
jgi:hypothetical protein